ncbi:uncharacterized protein LOC130818721 [Amaranthus tricolor]|uniref:uncharacterized protein LOC130818721 n=1 Tax=Amaranthus tricolor TaxID=29722 RepID=UPI002586A542|nr:uncharacterized protein LOC130818721 [Amaranthus tricolor]
MAEVKDPSGTSDLVPSNFLEVTCKSSGIVRRFAPGTKAGFAISLINNKLDVGSPLALYIEAAKFGEEPISFGPSSILVDYGNGWKLQTVLDSQQGTKKQEGLQEPKAGAKKQTPEPTINFMYISKIVFVFLFMFLLMGIFTLALENLPRLILFINSST